MTASTKQESLADVNVSVRQP